MLYSAIIRDGGVSEETFETYVKKSQYKKHSPAEE
jgi:hypothetical protein